MIVIISQPPPVFGIDFQNRVKRLADQSHRQAGVFAGIDPVFQIILVGPQLTADDKGRLPGKVASHATGQRGAGVKFGRLEVRAPVIAQGPEQHITRRHRFGKWVTLDRVHLRRICPQHHLKILWLHQRRRHADLKRANAVIHKTWRGREPVKRHAIQQHGRPAVHLKDNRRGSIIPTRRPAGQRIIVQQIFGGKVPPKGGGHAHHTAQHIVTRAGLRSGIPGDK